MRATLLVALQMALIAVLALPWDAPRWSAAATGLVALGIAIGLWALTANRPGNFNVRPEPVPTGYLATRGPYRYVRHPMYLALVVAGAGCAVGYASPWRWVALAALAAVLLAKAKLEEDGMVRRHSDYAAYAARTKRIVPFVW